MRQNDPYWEDIKASDCGFQRAMTNAANDGRERPPARRASVNPAPLPPTTCRGRAVPVTSGVACALASTFGIPAAVGAALPPDDIDDTDS